MGDYRSKAAQEWPYGTRGLVEEPDEAARVAARDARIKAYRERERARVVAAFDRFLERMFDDPFGERPEWNESAAFLPIYQAAETFVCCPMRMTFDNVAHQCAGEKGVPHEHSYPTAPVRPGDADYCGGDLAHPPHRVGTAPGCIACPTACPGVPHRGHTKSGTPCPIETVGIHQKAHYGASTDPRMRWATEGTEYPYRGGDQPPWHAYDAVPGQHACMHFDVNRGRCGLQEGDPVHRNPDYVAPRETMPESRERIAAEHQRAADYVAVEVLAPGGGRPGTGGGGGKGGSAYHPIGPCDDPGCCTPASEVRKMQGRE